MSGIQQMFVAGGKKVIKPFNLNSYTTVSLSTYRTLGADSYYNQLYLSDQQGTSTDMTRYDIATDGSLSNATTITTSTGSVPKRQVTFKPTVSSQAIITGYGTNSYALFSSRGNMFGSSSAVSLGSEFQTFNAWACAYITPTVMVVSGSDASAVSPYSSGGGIVVVNLATNAIRGVALSNLGGTSLTSGLAYDPLSSRLYVGLGANTATPLINVYEVSGTDYSSLTFSYLSQINTGFGAAIEAIGCTTDYLWYGGNGQPTIRRCARS